MRVPVVIAIGVCLLVATAGPSAGQDRPTYTIVPWVGVYLPTSELASDQNVVQPGSGLPATVSLSQQTGLAFGLRGGRTLTPKLALELELFLAASEIELTGVRPGVDQLSSTRDARLLVIGASVLYEVFRAPFTPFAVHILGGLGLISRGGDFFDDGGGFFGEIDGGSDVAFIAGGGFRYGLSSRVGLRVDFRDHISSYSQSIPGEELDAEIQNDILISAGLEVIF